MECDPDGGDERERDEGGHDNGYRPEQRTGDRGDQATAAERARHTPPERDIREQVYRWAAAVVVPALVALAFVAAVWVTLHAYEIIWWREARSRTRALRAPASAS